MRIAITTEYGQVKVGGVLLPGNLVEMEIEGGVRTDEMEVSGTSGTSKQPQGFKDSVVNLKLELPTDDIDTCYDKAKTIVSILQKVDKTAKPYIYPLVNRHTALWNITEVIFETLRTTENNKKDSITAELIFKEYKPVIVKSEARQPFDDILSEYEFGTSSTSVVDQISGIINKSPEEMVDDYVSGLIAKSPAVDDDYFNLSLDNMFSFLYP